MLRCRHSLVNRDRGGIVKGIWHIHTKAAQKGAGPHCAIPVPRAPRDKKPKTGKLRGTVARVATRNPKREEKRNSVSKIEEKKTET